MNPVPHRILIRVAAVLAAFCLAPHAVAETLLVRAGHLVDVERGQVLSDQAVRIENGRIVSVAPYRADAAKGARLLDWSAYTVTPGFMDMHTHLLGDILYADVEDYLKATPEGDVLAGAGNARVTLQAGFTTVRDVGAYNGFSDIVLRDAIAKGQVPGPRMFVSGAYLTVPGGGGEVSGLVDAGRIPARMRQGVARGVDEVAARTEAILDHGVDWVKMIVTGAVLTDGTDVKASEYGEDEIRAAVAAAGRRSRGVAAHAHGAQGIQYAIRAGARSIEHASLLDGEGIDLAVAHGTWLVMDIYNGDYIDSVGRAQGWSAEALRKNLDTTRAQREAFAKAHRAGARIAYGTDAGVYPHGDNAKQFPYMVRYGMTPMQAIQSATVRAAELLGRERELGSIAPGKAADLVALACDPIARIECTARVRWVIKDGVLHAGKESL